MSDQYTIILRGQRFTLTRDQIEADSPNYFTNCFLGEYRESQTREIRLGRHPVLFTLIVDHLSGYKILPLDDSVVIPGMSKERLMENLLADASFYSLDSLRAQIEQELTKEPMVTHTTYELWVRTSNDSGRCKANQFHRPMTGGQARTYASLKKLLESLQINSTYLDMMKCHGIRNGSKRLWVARVNCTLVGQRKHNTGHRNVVWLWLGKYELARLGQFKRFSDQPHACKCSM